VAVNAVDRLAEIDQVSYSHAVLTVVDLHVDAQPEHDPFSDVEPVYTYVYIAHALAVCMHGVNKTVTVHQCLHYTTSTSLRRH